MLIKYSISTPKNMDFRVDAIPLVHGDIDSWRKKWESYVFLMAKSMIIINAELHKDIKQHGCTLVQKPYLINY